MSGLDSYLEEIKQYPILDATEEKELAIKIANGDEFARDLLIKSNLRFVVIISKKYMGMGIPLEDLIQEGNIGLINATYKYDYKRGVRFNTYAKIYIKKNNKIY